MYILRQSDAVILCVVTVTAVYHSYGEKAAMPAGNLEKR